MTSVTKLVHIRTAGSRMLSLRSHWILNGYSKRFSFSNSAMKFILKISFSVFAFSCINTAISRCHMSQIFTGVYWQYILLSQHIDTVPEILQPLLSFCRHLLWHEQHFHPEFLKTSKVKICLGTWLNNVQTAQQARNVEPHQLQVGITWCYSSEQYHVQYTMNKTVFSISTLIAQGHKRIQSATILPSTGRGQSGIFESHLAVIIWAWQCCIFGTFYLAQQLIFKPVIT